MKTSTRSTLGILTAVAAAAAAYVLRPRPQVSHFGRKVVVITGASSGLGLAMAERFGQGGALLVLAARSLEGLEAARTKLIERGAVRFADDVLLVPADVSNQAQAAFLIQRTMEHFGRIDVLINNAGVIEVGPVENQPLEAYRRAMDTNFFGALHTVQAAMPYMLARASTGGKGAGSSIVNIASIGGKFAMPHLLPYVASKFALVGFSEGLHAELRGKGIRVTTVCPGLMRTGGEVHANYVGQVKKEERWFKLSARTPVVAASVTRAADKIYRAVAAGRAEITITPQAWLAARAVGIAPGTVQFVAGLINGYALPAASETASLPSLVAAHRLQS